MNATKLKMPSIKNPYGISVTELKKCIADWPETNDLGKPTEVWLSTGVFTSSPCVEVITLNVRKASNGSESGDILLSHKKG